MMFERGERANAISRKGQRDSVSRSSFLQRGKTRKRVRFAQSRTKPVREKLYKCSSLTSAMACGGGSVLTRVGSSGSAWISSTLSNLFIDWRTERMLCMDGRDEMGMSLRIKEVKFLKEQSNCQSTWHRFSSNLHRFGAILKWG